MMVLVIHWILVNLLQISLEKYHVEQDVKVRILLIDVFSVDLLIKFSTTNHCSRWWYSSCTSIDIN
jgi:hypothetical protein